MTLPASITGGVTTGHNAHHVSLHTWFNNQTVIQVPAGATEATIVSALSDAHAAGQGVVELLGPAYSLSGAIAMLITLPTVSLRGQGSAATIITYSGTGTCLKVYPSPATLQQLGRISGLTLRGTGAAGAIGVHCVDTVTTPFFEDVVIENFTDTNSVGLLFENIAYWNERAQGLRLHLNNNRVGMRLKGGGTGTTNSFGFHKWTDLRINLFDNQIGIQSTANAYVYSGYWNIVCNQGGNNGIVIDLAGTSAWQRADMVAYGEQTTGTGGKGVRVGSSSYFNVHGTLALGVPNQNLNTGIAANNAVPPSLRCSLPTLVVEDAGARANFVGATPAAIIPWLTSGESSDIASVGWLNGTNIASPYVSMYDAAGNAFVVYKVGFGQPIQNATELARIGADGDLTLPSGAVVAGRRKLKEGANQTNGYGQLTAGALTVSNTLVTANTRVRVTRETPAGTLGHVYCRFFDHVPGTSFTIRSSSATDTSWVFWDMYEPV